MVPRKLMTTREAAAYLTKELGINVTPNLLAQWRHREEGPPWRRVKGRIYYHPRDLELFVRQRKAGYCWPVGIVVRALLIAAPEILEDYVSIDSLRADVASFGRNGKLTWQAALLASQAICPWLSETAFQDAMLTATQLKELVRGKSA